VATIRRDQLRVIKSDQLVAVRSDPRTFHLLQAARAVSHNCVSDTLRYAELCRFYPLTC
jgi:hypothetical protein